MGTGLMICPVVEARATERRILLPPGVWHDFWTQASWQGPGEIVYPAPLDRLPILVRGGTILPMGPILQSIPDDHCFDTLHLHIWPPYPANGLIYEDDGVTLDYTRGDWSRTQVAAEQEGSRIMVHIFSAQGSYPGQPSTRQVDPILYRTKSPAQAFVNGQPSLDWSYDQHPADLQRPRRDDYRDPGAILDLLPGIPTVSISL